MPPEFCAQIESTVKQVYAPFLQGYEHEVEGRIYPEEMMLRLGFFRPGALRQANFEASLAYKADKDKAIERIYLAVDVLGQMIEEYFRNSTEEDADLDLPLIWEPQTYQGSEIFVQYTTVNTRLEAEADRLLGADADLGLVRHELDGAEEPDQMIH
jgi:hypothetical protein